MLSSHIAFIFALTLAFCILHGGTAKKAKKDDKPSKKEETDADYLAGNITHGLMNSEVLGKSAHFTFHEPHDVFFRASTKLLAKAGFDDPALAEVAAHAGQVIGDISSKVYFRAIGQELAKFLDYAGVLSRDNVIPFSYMVVNSIELEACTNGVSDPETVANAVVYGIYDVLDALNLVSKDKMEELFHVFAEEIQEQAREASYEVVYEIFGTYKVHPE